jgi:hypothetical protein
MKLRLAMEDVGQGKVRDEIGDVKTEDLRRVTAMASHTLLGIKVISGFVVFRKWLLSSWMAVFSSL